MYGSKKINTLEDYFQNLSARHEKGTYFYRIAGYNETVQAFLQKYYEAARDLGVVVEGKIQNPDQHHLSYYEDIMGKDFRADRDFIFASLGKWLPRMGSGQRANVAGSICHILRELQGQGKNESMLKNLYIKFMCWLYYKFERAVRSLGQEAVPKILYEGEPSRYELFFLSVLLNAGCDIVLLECHGDEGYQKADPSSRYSFLFQMPGLEKFPEGYSLKTIQDAILIKKNRERLYGKNSAAIPCTNAWIEGKGVEDIKTDVPSRGAEDNMFYNCLIRMNGVEDKMAYLNTLYQLYVDVSDARRGTVILEGEIPRPSNEEIAAVVRGNYVKPEQMITGLLPNLRFGADVHLQGMLDRAFVDFLYAELDCFPGQMNKVVNEAVYLICWVKRYFHALFSRWKPWDILCFFYLGGCKDRREALFVQFLSKLPVDVLILCPGQNDRCCLEDPRLYEINYSDRMSVSKFPKEASDLHLGTAAYHAERELDTLLYQDSGMYRNQQYTKANVINLQTMYEEIPILWKEEVTCRPNFSTDGDTVCIPAIMAKVSGVKDGNVAQYWSDVKKLMTDDTFVIKNVPYLRPADANPMKACAVSFFRNGRVQARAIKKHKQYAYGFLREDRQDYILDKLQLLIDQKLIRGTFENGTEYTVIAVVLNLGREILRLIQKMDFTKKNPKLLYIHTSEATMTLEDAILAAFLYLTGFDVVFFVPTGYQCVEPFFTRPLLEEHQIGEYVYDLEVPDFGKIPMVRRSWRDKFFRRK